jgi:hypothetical protein
LFIVEERPVLQFWFEDEHSGTRIRNMSFDESSQSQYLCSPPTLTLEKLVMSVFRLSGFRVATDTTYRDSFSTTSLTNARFHLPYVLFQVLSLEQVLKRLESVVLFVQSLKLFLFLSVLCDSSVTAVLIS